MVRHVECREPGVDVRLHLAGGCREVELPAVAFHVGDLPQAREDPGNTQIRRQVPALDSCFFHSFGYSGGKVEKRACTSTPLRRSRVSSRA